MALRPRVLIIDDVSDSIDVLMNALGSAFDVSFALSGPEGLQSIHEHQPDLVLLDVMMPGMNGYEVFAELQTQEKTAHIPVIFVTAKNDLLSETSAINAGAVDFINKPINPTVVKARVRMHLAHQAREREVRQLNAELELRVQERTQVLKVALVKAEAARQAKATLMANMSHEFRTPLNAILGMSYLVSKATSDPQILEKVDRITLSGKTLLGLLNDILDMARLEANKFQIEKMDFSLQTVVDTCLELVSARAQTKGIALVQEIDGATPLDLHGDPLRLGQILSNFMGNAVKFSWQGPVTLRVRLSDTRGPIRMLRFEVEDRGVGVRSDDQARIFEPFEQADNSLTREYGGVGIGLPICKFLTRMMGGTIGLSSQSGQGSTFWAVIPFELGTTPVASVEGVNWNKVKQVAGHLLALLDEDGMSAQAVWQSSRPLLDVLLGNRNEMFSNAICAYDFVAARYILQLALQGQAQLHQTSP